VQNSISVIPRHINNIVDGIKFAIPYLENFFRR